MLWEKLHIVTEAQLERVEEIRDMVPISGPVKRWGHTFNAIGGGNLLYTFGGYDNHDNPTNKVLVFDTAAHRWSEPVIRGVPPVPRDRHCGTVIEDKLFVFGGVDDGMQLYSDLHVLDTSTNTWISPRDRGEVPKARKGHGAALIGKNLYVFGGCVKLSCFMSEVYDNDLYILNTGTPPAKRENHSCSSWKNKLIVIGGIDVDNNYLADVHILDADTLVWRNLNTRGQLLPPRAGHTTVALGRNLFVFGGFVGNQIMYDDFHRLDLDTGVWTKLMTTGEGPSPRFFMAGDSLDLQIAGTLVLFGGCNQCFDPTDDVYYLHTGCTFSLRMENDGDGQGLDKSSPRKEEKFKEQAMLTSPVNDEASARCEANADGFNSMPIPSSESTKQNTNLREYYPFPGKRVFQAKVIESLPAGYTIETVIDGKLLRGVIFPNNSSSSSIDDNPTREHGAVNIDGKQLNDNEKSESVRPTPISQNQADDGKEYIDHEKNMDCDAASIMPSPIPDDVFQLP